MKRIIMVLASALACAGATLALAMPAQAAPTQPAAPAAAGCPSDAFCLYPNVNFNGSPLIFKDDGKACRLTGFHDRASSAINNRNDKVVLYRDAGCDGPTLTIQPGARNASFVDEGFNDKADGIRLF